MKKIFIGIILVVVVVGVYRTVVHQRSGAPKPFLGREVPAGQKLYHNPPYHFSLFYPEDLTVRFAGEGGSAATITFESPDKQHGFQIFVRPYTETQISDERFRLDNPSGVRNDLQEGMIGGTTTAAFFFSEDPRLGPVREVWFINKGFLYEISAPAALDAWLLSILTTWEFYDPA